MGRVSTKDSGMKKSADDDVESMGAINMQTPSSDDDFEGMGVQGRGQGGLGGLSPQNKKLAPPKNYQPNPPNPSPNFLFFNKV